MGPGQGATGWLVGGVVLRNDGRPCSLVGAPKLVVSVPGARVRPLTADQVSSQQRQPDALPAAFSLRAVPRGGAVTFSYWWSNWCGRATPVLAVRLPSGDTFRVPTRGAPACQSASAPLNVDVGRFVQWDAAPKPSTHLRFAIGFPRLTYEARAGSVLRYEVTLRNAGKRTFTFRRCPVYQESLALGPAGIVREDHILNCRAVRTFAPGETRTFEMQMRVPRRAAGKSSPIFFELGLGTYEPPQAGGARAAIAVLS